MNESFDIKSLLGALKRQLKLELDYSKLTAVEKTSVLLSRLALIAVLIIIGCFVANYLCSALVVLLTQLTGMAWLANMIVAIILLVAMLVVYAFRKQWIIDPITKFITKLFLNSDK